MLRGFGDFFAYTIILLTYSSSEIKVNESMMNSIEKDNFIDDKTMEIKGF